MPPKDTYKDDTALTSFLDNLITTAQTPDLVYAPSNPHSPQDSSPHNTAAQIPSQDHPDLPVLLSQANELLIEGRQCPPLPPLSSNHDNLSTLLTSALTCIIRLSKCCGANVKLRLEAENTVQNTHAHLDRVTRALATAKDKAERKDATLVQTKALLEDTEVKYRHRVRQLVKENTELKRVVVNAGHRENHMIMEAKKREKEYTALQARVHALMGEAKRCSIEPNITPGERGRLAVDTMRRKLSEENCDDSNVGEGVCRILGENRDLKALVREIHLEFDEMFASFAKAFGFEDGEGGGGDEDADNEGVDHDINKIPAPALSEERMSLPYELIREEVEVGLDEKLEAVRSALANLE